MLFCCSPHEQTPWNPPTQTTKFRRKQLLRTSICMENVQLQSADNMEVKEYCSNSKCRATSEECNRHTGGVPINRTSCTLIFRDQNERNFDVESVDGCEKMFGATTHQIETRTEDEWESWWATNLNAAFDIKVRISSRHTGGYEFLLFDVISPRFKIPAEQTENENIFDPQASTQNPGTDQFCFMYCSF
jgi:hypothetical protein